MFDGEASTVFVALSDCEHRDAADGRAVAGRSVAHDLQCGQHARMVPGREVHVGVPVLDKKQAAARDGDATCEGEVL